MKFVNLCFRYYVKWNANETNEVLSFIHVVDHIVRSTVHSKSFAYCQKLTKQRGENLKILFYFMQTKTICLNLPT